jgi:archaellum component FlaF (FlaF/FlaG flagellin family)
MNNDLKYIDKLAKDKLSGFTLEHNMSWEAFQKSYIASNAIKSVTNLSKFSSLISFKALFVLTIVVVLSGLTYLRTVNSDEKQNAAKIISKNISENYFAKLHQKEYIDKSNETVIKPKIKEKESTVVVIKKQVIIRDTVYINESKSNK